MSTLYHAHGIVLSRRDRGEADRWYSVLTREHGKIEVLARGGHKLLAKLTPHLEMPAEVELLVVNGRQYDTVAGVERRRGFSNVYSDLAKLLLVKNALHLTDMGTRTNEADPVLYDELVAWLAFVDQAPTLSVERSGFLLGSFALKLLALLGYRPELSRCLSCKISVAAGSYRWHAPKGGVVCQPCVLEDQEQWFAARTFTDETLKLMRFAMTESFSEQIRPRLPGDVLLSFHDAVESLIISHFPVIPASSLREAVRV